MNKNYTYNPSGLKEAIERHHIKKVDLKNLFKYVNYIQINRWLDGNDIYVSKACEICDRFGLDFVEVFLKVVEPEEKEQRTVAASEQRTGNERPSREDVLALRMHEEKGKGTGDLSMVLRWVEEAREAEYQRNKAVLEEERANARHNAERMMDKFEDQLIQKNEDILAEKKKNNALELKYKELEMKFNELTRQYKELEMKSQSFHGSLGIAEKPYLSK